MLSIRRALNPFRKQGSLVVSPRLLYTREEVHTCFVENLSVGFAGNGESQSDRSPFLARFFDSSFGSQKLLWGTRSFSSEVGTKSGDEEVDDMEDGCSELEHSVASDRIPRITAGVDDSDNELPSGPEFSVDDTNEIDGTRELLDVSDAEVDVVKKSKGKGKHLGLLNSILASPALSVPQVVEKWVEQGNEISRSDFSLAMVGLRVRRAYVKALQLSEWWMVNKGEFAESDYASHADLIAKVHGLKKAEDYIGKIPQDFRTETVYRRLMANSFSQCNLKKCEEIFKKMKDLGFPITCSTYNQLLLMYKRVNKKKIADVLVLMHQKNVNPDRFTYKILIDVRGQSKDIAGMDKIVETMKNDGIEPDFSSQAIVARHYISAGLQDKAVDVLKQMEESNDKEKRWVILLHYAALRKADDVKRIWSECESNPSIAECIAAINAWGKLRRINEAEAVFDRMSNKFKKLPLRSYAAMLRVYADNKMLSKGKDLVKQMAVNGYQTGIPLLWDSLVKLYVEAGELDNAVNVLHTAVQQSRLKPMCKSYTAVMDEYAKEGDVHNTEKVLRMRRRAGYLSQLRTYQTLVKAYINGKAFAYGIDERMEADKVFPNKTLAAQLAIVDPFRKTAVSELLD